MPHTEHPRSPSSAIRWRNRRRRSRAKWKSRATRCSEARFATFATSRTCRLHESRGCSWPAHQADEDLLERALARLQVLEVDAQLGQLTKQAGDGRAVITRVERIDQSMMV